MAKLPYDCPKCGAPVMNYSGVCGACGHGTEPSVNDIADEVLLGRVVRGIKSVRGGRRPKVVRWSVVADRFALGSTYAAQLCRRYGVDPDEIVNRY